MPDVFRKQYRTLTDIEKQRLAAVKDQAQVLYDVFSDISLASGGTRELSLAKTKLEEAVMWATKAVTG